MRGVELVGDVMVDLARMLGPIASERSAYPGRARARARLLRARDRPPPGQHRAARARPARRGPAAVEGPVVLPLHPRTREALAGAGLLDEIERRLHVLPPLGYLDFTALLRAARVCLTDSGGVQKEAYLHSRPVRDAARHDGVGRDGAARLERPRRRRPARRSPRPPPTRRAAVASRGLRRRPSAGRMARLVTGSPVAHRLG